MNQQDEYFMIEFNEKINNGKKTTVDEKNKAISLLIWGTVIKTFEPPKKIGENRYQQRFANGLKVDYSFSKDGKDLRIDYEFESGKKSDSKQKVDKKKVNATKKESELVVELKDFMLHKTRRTKFNDKSGTKLAEDLLHHQKSFEQIFGNPVIRDQIYKVLKHKLLNIEFFKIAKGTVKEIGKKINEKDEYKKIEKIVKEKWELIKILNNKIEDNISNNSVTKKIKDSDIYKWYEDELKKENESIEKAKKENNRIEEATKIKYLRTAFSEKNIGTTKAILERDFELFINGVWKLGETKEFRFGWLMEEERDIAESIIKEFKQSKIMVEYEYKKLTEMVKNHPSTIERIKFVRDNFEEFIKNHIEKLKTGKDSYLKKIGFEERAELDKEIEIESNKIKKDQNINPDEKIKIGLEIDKNGYKIIKNKKNKNIAYLNYFLARERKIPGYNGAESLAIIIGSLWAYEIKVKKLKIYTDNSFDYEFDIIFYDHFGLDPSDVTPNGAQSPVKRVAIEGVSGFSSWYVLQHFKEFLGSYTPMIVKMPFTYSKEELKKL